MKSSNNLLSAYEELAFQNQKQEKRILELIITNKELLEQNKEKTRIEEQTQFQRNNLSALINNTNDLMWSVDTSFKLITSNKAFDKMMTLMLGKPIAVGANAIDIGFSPERLAKYKKIYDRAFAGEVFTEIEYTEEPHEFWSELSFYPIHNGGKIIGTACHSRNITVSKKTELERIKITKDLIQRNKDLEEFTQIVSHNLRAHVASIIGATNLFNNVKLTPNEKTIICQGLNEAANRLDDVVTDMNRALQKKQGTNVLPANESR